MADLSQQAALNQISAQLASSKDGGYLEAIANKLGAKGTGGDDPFAGFKIPQLTDIAKGLTFGLAPGLIKKSVAGMQIFMDSLNSMVVDDVEKSSAIIELVGDYSSAMTNFGEIPWMKALKGTFLLKSFTERFIKIGEVLGSPENITRLRPFQRFARTFGTPLKLIGDALKTFDKIQWTKMFFSTKIFERLIASFIKIGNSVNDNKKLLQDLSSILMSMSKPLGNFFESFNTIKFTKMLIGGLLLGKLIVSLLSPAKLLSKNKQIFKRFGETLNSINEPLGNFFENFNKIKFTKMLIGGLLLEKVIKGLVKIGKLVSDNKKSLENFGKTLNSINEPLGNFAESFNKIGNGLIKAALSLLIVAGSLGLAALGIQQFGNISLVQAISGIITLGVLMISVQKLSKIANSAIKGAAALAIVAATLGITAISLKLFSKGIEWPAVIGGIAALSVMAAGLKLLSKGGMEMIKGAAALTIVAASLGVAALSFMLFNIVNWPSVAKGMIALAGIVGALAVVGAIMKSPAGLAIIVGAAALALVGVAMIPFAAGMAILGTINYKKFNGIFGALAALAGGITLLTFAIPAMIVSAIAIIPFAAGMALLSVINWTKISKGIKEIGGAGPGLISASKGILALSGALLAFTGAQIVAGLGNLIGKILRFGNDSPIQQLIKLAKYGYNLSILGTGVKDLAAGLRALTGINSELDILETLANKFKNFDALDPTGIKAFAEGLNMLVDALSALSQLDGKLAVLNQIPYDKIGNLVSSVQPGSPLIQIVNGLKESSDSQQTAQLLKQSIESNAPTVGSQLRESGSSMNSSAVIINNNNGGNVTNNSSTSSNVNNNGSVDTPIITASGSGMFTAE